MSASDLAAAFSGATGQVVGCACTFPVDVIKIRLMATSTTVTKNQITLITEMIAQEGLYNVYKRFPAKGLQQGASRFCYYYVYAYFVRSMTNNQSGRLGFWSNLVIGYIAGVLNTIPSNPLEIAAVKIMKSPKRLSFIQVMTDIYHTEGIAGFYRGWQLTFVTSLNPAIQNTVFDQIKLWWLRRKQRSVVGKNGSGSAAATAAAAALYLSGFESFWLGAFAKAIATVATFPFSRAKIMASDGEQLSETDENVLQVLWKVYQTDGVSGLFQGLTPSLTKSVSQSAIMLMVREKVDEYSRAFVLNLVGGSSS